MRAVVVGAGLGGLSAGLALRQVGIEVEIVEQAPQLGEVGAGIQISANASKVMTWLGLEDAIRKKSFRPNSMIGFDWQSGKQLYERPLGDAYVERFGAPYYQIHRADLHEILTDAFGLDGIQLGFSAGTIEQTSSGVRARAADGRTAEGDILIGADGIKSATRMALGLEDTPIYTGMTAYRGVVEASKLPDGLFPLASSNWMGPHGHIVVYYLRGTELVNMVAVSEVANWSAEGWFEEVSTEDVLARFEGWSENVRTLIRAVERPFQWGLYGRAPTSAWGKDRITLLGDSVHPMVPFLAQGAAMAIEDGAILARCLVTTDGTPETALRRYEDLRRDRTARVQMAALHRGQQLHLSDRADIERRNDSYARQQSLGQFYPEFDWIYAYDPIRIVSGAGST